MRTGRAGRKAFHGCKTFFGPKRKARRAVCSSFSRSSQSKDTLPHTGRGCPARNSGTRYENAAFTRSGENGTRRMRTPVASKMALAMAAAVGRIDGSPAPEEGISG